MKDWEEELRGYADWATNFVLEDTQNEYTGSPVKLCIRLEDVEEFIEKYFVLKTEE